MTFPTLLPTFPPHALLEQEFAEHSPDTWRDLVKSVEDLEAQFGPLYVEHRAVRTKAPGEVVVPWALYIDGISFQDHDGVLGLWAHNLCSGKRHLLAALRSTENCNCGCSGWCSVRPILDMITWSGDAGQRGESPTAREHGMSWRSGLDDVYAERAGQPLRCKSALLFIKSDLKELCTSLGFPSTGSNIPCCICLCSRETWSDMSDVSPMGHGWGELDVATYDAAARACEVEVLLGRESYTEVRKHLDIDRRPIGARGRALTQSIPALNLERGDRLEPSACLPNTARFDEMRPGEGERVRISFWRRSRETRVRHRCPLFGEPLGLSPHRCLGVDWQHAKSLGTFSYYVNGFVHALIESSDFGGPATTALERQHNVLMELQRRMGVWLAAEMRQGRKRSLPNNFTSGMLGKKGSTVSLAAAETNDVLVFLVEEIFDRQVVPLVGSEWRAWGEAGKHLMNILSFFKVHKGGPTNAATQDQPLLF